jgi:hypothetical protein
MAGEKMMKRKKKMGKTVVWLAGFLMTVHAVLAAPSYITDGLMDWQRGADGSTWQEWTFEQGMAPAAPDAGFNPYGTASAAIYGYDGSVSFGWKPAILGREGVWTGDPVFVELLIPDSPDANPVKTIWFEMDYRAVTMLNPALLVGDGFEVEPFYYDSGLRRDQNGIVIDDWRTMVIGWNIYPNPSQEIITFALAGTGGFVDRISVDTMCRPIPEPSALLLSGIGVFMAAYFKRRKAI